jgi:HK97 family phage major capsid protein
MRRVADQLSERKKGSTIMNHNELRNICAEKMDRMKAILTSAEADGRDLTSDEALEFDRLDNELRAISKLNKNSDGLPNKRAAHDRLTNLEAGLSQMIVNPHHVRNFGQSESAHEPWIDASTGRTLVLVDREQSVVAELRKHRGVEAVPYTFADLVRAIAQGPKTENEVRALNESTGSQGQYTVPVILQGQILDLMRPLSQVMRAGGRMLMLDTNVTNIATVASDPVPAWRLENATIGTSEPTFGQLTLTSRSLSLAFQVSRELLFDGIGIQDAIHNVIAQSFANAVDLAMLAGSGTAPEPRGLKNWPGVASVSAGTNGAAPTDYGWISTCVQNILTANYPLENISAIMHPRSFMEYSSLKDTQNNPLRRPPALEYIPFLPTSKISIADVQGTSSTASRIYVGDFRNVVLGVRHGLIIQQLVERYADVGQVGFVAHLRADVLIQRPGAFSIVVGVN